MSETPYPRRRRVFRPGRPAAIAAALLAVGLSAAPATAATASLTATGLSSPGGAVWLPDAAGGGHLWVADHIRGFCRVDGGTLAASSCVQDAVSPGQPSFDAARNLVYLPDNAAKGMGVVRLTYDPATGSFTDSAVIAPQAGLAGNRPTTSALGPDGRLYVGFLKNGNVVRINTPEGAAQTVQSVGSTADARRPGGLAFRGNDLYLAEGGAVTRMANATSTACTGGCRAGAVSGLSTPAPLSITYDAATDRLFIGTATDIVRFTPATRLQETLASTGSYPDGTSVPLANVSAVAMTPGDVLAAADDTTGGVQALTGRLWTMLGSGAPVAGGGGTPPPPPPPPPPPAPSSTASSVASGLTAPAGSLWLPDASGSGHLWVADHLQGLCRVDPATQALVAGTCSTAALSPGQPSFDPTRNLVYVPDNAAKGAGVVRLDWDPATESFVGDTVIAPQAGLAGNRPTTSALGPDGRLYVGFLKNGNVVRINTPEGAAQTVQSVGSTADARRPGGLAFRGNDLYLAEGGAVTRMANATSTACTGGCRAGAVGISMATAPLTVAYDSLRDVLYAGDATAGVIRFAFSTRTQSILANSGTSSTGPTTLSNVSALALDGSSQSLYVGDDPTAGAGVLAGRLWLVSPLG